MKNLKKFLAVLFIAIMASSVLAQDNTNTNNLRLFHISTSPERWEETRAMWERDKILNGENLTVDKLYPLLRRVAVQENHPAAELSDQAFAALMAARNPGLPATGTVNEQTLRFMAQGKGIYLPTPEAVATALRVAEVPATPVASTPAPTLPVAGDATQSVAIANMESQVKALQTALARSGAAERQVATLGRRLTTLGQELNVLKEGQGQFVQKDELTKLGLELEAVKQEAARIGAIAAEVEVLKTNYDSLEARLTAVEQNPLMRVSTLQLAVYGVLLLISGIAALWLRRRTSAKIRSVESNLTALSGNATEALGKAREAETKSAAAVTKVTVVEGEVKKLTGRRQVSFPLDFDVKVDSLTEAGQECHFTVTIDDEHECHLSISLRGDNLYHVSGIEDLTTGVSRKGLKKTIGNAATIIDGKSRLVGVWSESVDSILTA